MLKFDASDFIAKTNQIAENLQRSSEEITHFGALEVWRKSQQIVPVDTRLLKSTGYLATKATGVRATVEIGYGGPIAGFENDYVFYAATQERNRKYLANSVSNEIFKRGLFSAIKTFLRKPTQVFFSRQIDPPYESQSNSRSEVLVVKKAKQDGREV
tara:strand:+ start:732 stop:1202 length:471 start_codon:yes stop_codon:yes gene_type:complete